MSSQGELQSDERLAAAAQQGDEGALEELFARHAAPLQALLLRRVPPVLRRKVSIADILQETHTAVWSSIGAFQDRGPGSLRAWLFRIADHKAKNVVRGLLRDRRDVRREVPHDGSGVRELAAGRPETPSAHAIARELEERLRTAMDGLTPPQRQVLSLVLVEGVSMAEAGARMARSPNAVQKLFQRAKERLWTDCYGADGARG